MRRENVKAKTKTKSKDKKFSVKAYIRDFLLFVDKELIKTTGILLVVAILLIAISLSSIVSMNVAKDCEGTCRDGVTFLSEYGSRLQVLLITAISGIVPYIFAPVVGFIGGILAEVSNLSFVIKGYGYLAGIGLGIVPLILNVVVVCIVTALGIYICRTITVGYKISSVKNMNFTNFRIRFYEAIQNEEKAKALTKARDEKINKLQNKKEKINYLQILNVTIVVCIIQFIAVLIQEIIL